MESVGGLPRQVVGVGVGAARQVALRAGVAEVSDSVQIGDGFYSFCHGHRVQVLGNADERTDGAGAGVIGSDSADQRLVDLDDLWPQFHDGPQRGVACACIVDGQTQSPLPQGCQAAPERMVGINGVRFGELKDQPAQVHAGSAQGPVR